MLGKIMDKINTEYLQKCLETLIKSYELIMSANQESIEYEVYRNSLVKGFELALEQSGKLLKKKLVPYFASKSSIDALSFKDIFRNANKYLSLDENAVNRWFKYRDNRNNTAYDYGKRFVEETLSLIEDFIKDVEKIKEIIDND